MKEIIYGKEVYTVSDTEISEIIDRRKAFVIYKDRFSMVKYLDQTQKAQILDIIYEYQIEGARELPEGLDQITEAVADQILKGFQLADDSYIKKSVINGVNGRKGGRK
ncbi:MAG: hypothetical protein IJ181_13825, partial [Acidaminococcaceae bacterium]|nr:hypothetical protein [Acidaminococcaceae bacterium]